MKAFSILDWESSEGGTVGLPGGDRDLDLDLDLLFVAAEGEMLRVGVLALEEILPCPFGLLDVISTLKVLCPFLLNFRTPWSFLFHINTVVIAGNNNIVMS